MFAGPRGWPLGCKGIQDASSSSQGCWQSPRELASEQQTLSWGADDGSGRGRQGREEQRARRESEAGGGRRWRVLSRGGLAAGLGGCLGHPLC